jgi:hypothetical protein
MGEGIFEVLVQTAENNLQTFNEALLTEARRQAGDAAASATTAHEEADAVKAEARALKTQLGALSKRAEGIDKSLEGVEWAVSARRVQDVDGLTADLKKKFHGRRIVLKSYFGNDDDFWLCSQLVDIARKAEMDPQNECSHEPKPSVPVTDMLVGAPTIEEAQSFSMVLKKPRRVPGVFVALHTDPVLTILVGVQPAVPLWPRANKGKH